MRASRLSPITNVMVIAACLYGLWQLAPDLAFSLEGAPRDLGRPPAATSLEAGGHVRLGGTVLAATSAELQGETRELAILAEAPVAVLLRPGAARPAGTIEAQGRLYRADRLGSVYAGNPWVPIAQARGVTLEELCVLMDGVSPGLPWKTIGWATLLAAMLAFTVYRLARTLRPARSASMEIE